MKSVNIQNRGYMQGLFEFLDGEETEEIPTPDEGLQEWLIVL